MTQRLGDSNYEKIRFLALIYNRLGRLFLNENYCELAITKYRKALKYFEILDDNISKANVLKELGNSHQLDNKPDSALYYYYESLNYNSSLLNKLDVEKSIAKILFYEGEKDSAYRLIIDNLNKINNEDLRYSYHYTLGDMFFRDNKYDSALYYLETSLDDDMLTTRLAFCTTLSSIYDSLDNREKKAYYDNISSKLLVENLNKEIVKSKLQILYDKYKERKLEKEKVRNRNKIIAFALLLLAFAFLIFIVVLILIRYRYRRKSMKFLDIIESNNDVINQISEDNEVKQSKILEYSRTIEENEENIALLEKELKNKDNNIDSLKKEIKKIRQGSGKENKTINIESYYGADICQKILKRKESDFSPLSEEDLALLLQAADDKLGNFTEKLKEKYSRLSKDDMYCICLLLLNINRNRLYHLLGRNRKTIWERLNKIKSIMNIGDDDDMFLYLKGVLYR